MITDANEQDSDLRSHVLDAQLLHFLVRGKWRLSVLRELEAGANRLSQLRRAIPTASKKMLIDTLRFLTENGLIDRVEYPGQRRHVEYSLKPERADSVRRILSQVHPPPNG